ncbi:MAG: ankyrin repeat domain-containing protein [Elusimicrobia bacterium]|nr:ankyrin repeat domain-containing protein [Elusimicrobiota bacterium]
MESSEKTTQLIKAIKTGNVQDAEDLIQEGADIEEPDVQGWTPLVHAANRGNAQIIERLISAGARINDTKEGGSFALMAALLGDHIAAFRVLLGAGARASLVDGIPFEKLAHGHLKHGKEMVRLLAEAAGRSTP